MTDKMRYILFFPTYPVAVHEMILIAREVAKRDVTPLFLITNQDASDAMPPKEAWFETVELEFTPRKNSKHAPNLIGKVKQQIARIPWVDELWSRRYSVRTWNNLDALVKDEVVQLKREYERLEKALGGYDILAVTTNAVDRTVNYSQPLFKLCREEGIPCCLPPIFQTVRDDTPPPNGQLSSYLFSGLLEKYEYMGWRDSSGRIGFKVPPYKLIAMDTLGMLPDRYGIRYGVSPYIFVEGENGKNIRLEMGHPVNRVIVTGMASLDKLHTTLAGKSDLRHVIEDKYGVQKDDRILIVALPQGYAHGTVTLEEEQENFDNLFEMLRGVPAKLLVSLHPRVRLSDYAYIERKYGVRLLEERLYNILPVADLFLADWSSTTLMWGVLCQIPTFGYISPSSVDEIMHGLPDVFMSSDIEALGDEIYRACSFDEVYGRHVERSIADAAIWDVFDGKSTARIADNVIKLAGIDGNYAG